MEGSEYSSMYLPKPVRLSLSDDSYQSSNDTSMVSRDVDPTSFYTEYISPDEETLFRADADKSLEGYRKMQRLAALRRAESVPTGQPRDSTRLAALRRTRSVPTARDSTEIQFSFRRKEADQTVLAPEEETAVPPPAKAAPKPKARSVNLPKEGKPAAAKGKDKTTCSYSTRVTKKKKKKILKSGKAFSKTMRSTPKRCKSSKGKGKTRMTKTVPNHADSGSSQLYWV